MVGKKKTTRNGKNGRGHERKSGGKTCGGGGGQIPKKKGLGVKKLWGMIKSLRYLLSLAKGSEKKRPVLRTGGKTKCVKVTHRADKMPTRKRGGNMANLEKRDKNGMKTVFIRYKDAKGCAGRKKKRGGGCQKKRGNPGPGKTNVDGKEELGKSGLTCGVYKGRGGEILRLRGGGPLDELQIGRFIEGRAHKGVQQRPIRTAITKQRSPGKNQTQRKRFMGGGGRENQ